MSVKSGYFNSKSGDRKYNARDISMSFKGIIPDGVYAGIGGKFEVTSGEGMTVNVASGRAVIDGQWINSDESVTMAIDAATANTTRIDAIVLRLDLSASVRNFTIAVKNGTAAASNPEMPARTWTDTVKELFLASVTVANGTTEITQDLISDLRGTSHCLYITGIVDQVKTASLFEEYKNKCVNYIAVKNTLINISAAKTQADFTAWLDELIENNTINTTVKKYQHFAVYRGASGYLDKVKMPLYQYDSRAALFVHIGGILLIPNVDYKISGTGTNAIITFTRRIKDNGEGIPLSFTVVKNEIGGIKNSNGLVTAAIIKNAPAAADVAGIRRALAQYDPNGTAVVSGDKTNIFRASKIYAEELNPDFRPIIELLFENSLANTGKVKYDIHRNTSGSSVLYNSSGKTGSCYSATNDSQIILGGTASLFQTEFTLAMWFKINSDTKDFRQLFGLKYTNFFGVDYRLEAGISLFNGETKLSYRNKTTVTNKYYRTEAVDDGEWHFLAWSCKKINDTSFGGNLYVDKSSVNQTMTVNVGGLYAQNAFGDIEINSCDYGLNGYIDSVRIYNKAMTKEEIMTNIYPLG